MKTVWTKQVDMPRFPKLHGDIKTDVLVIGGGIAGLLCAYALKQAGVDCVLIESNRICGGTTMGTTAKITSQHGLVYHTLSRRLGDEKAKLYWRANEDALGRYRLLANKYPCVFEMKINYIYSKNNIRILETEMNALNRLGIPAEFCENIGLPFPVSGAVSFSNQAQFHPLRFLSQIAGELTIYENTVAKEFKGNIVSTESGSISAEKIIVATHFPILNKHGAYFMKMYQSRSYLMAVNGAGDIGGMYLSADGDALSLRSQDGILLAGCGSHRTGKKSNGWILAENTVREYFPGGEIVCKWAAQDCMTLDGVPYVGQYSPSTPDLYVATGFNKWGMTGAMAAAAVLADLVQGKENPYEELFSPSRSILRPQLFINGVESVSNLLRFTGPRCPHLGCKLKWNPLEHSWDCPCHGSRFSEQGTLLDGPSTADLRTRRPK